MNRPNRASGQGSPAQPAGSTLARIGALAMIAVAAALTGCAGQGMRRPADAALLQPAPGWSVRSGQAVWTSATGAEGVAGELLWAGEGTGGFLLEFSKPALPLVRVVRRGTAWEVSAPGRGQRAGRGEPPPLSWFVLGRFLSGGAVEAPWSAGRESGGGGWWVENARTGERIEGFLEGR